MLMERQPFLKRLFTVASWALAPLDSAQAFSSIRASQVQADTSSLQVPIADQPTDTPVSSSLAVAYKELSLPVDQYGVKVPVACWFPCSNEEMDSSRPSRNPEYPYRISVRKIGQMLAGWDFIPGFYARDFSLVPSRNGVALGSDLSLPKSAPVILLAHGYLGSRFDLSHLAEALVSEGFLCLSAEYPESLAASYDRAEGLDRSVINNQLLSYLQGDLGIEGTKFGIVGHSLGCGTAIRTGDENWARVLIAGGPRLPDGSVIPGNALFISSMNDGAVSPARFGGAQGYPKDIVMLKEDELFSSSQLVPSRAAILFDRPDAPNHVSFLTESVNDAMIDFLSALLPVAKAFEIPVLDFDRYQVSRDSRQTAQIVHPLVVQYLKQEMRMKDS